MSEILTIPPKQEENTSPTEKRAWAKSGPKKKDAKYYEEQRGKFDKYLQGNEFLTILEALEAVNAKIISLLTTDVKSHRLIGVSTESMEEALKSLKIMRSNAMWDHLLSSEQEANQLTGNVLLASSLRFQTEYIGTRRTNITVYGVPVDITEGGIGAFFAKYGPVDDVSVVKSKSGIATGDMVLQVVLTRQTFLDILTGTKECLLW